MAIFTIIGGVIGALFGSALLGKIVASALAFGTKLALSYINRGKRRAYSAVSGEIEYGGRVPVSVVYGTGKVAGHRIGYFKWGRGNKINADVFVLANGWCDGLEEEVYFYGQKWNLIPADPIGNETAHYRVEDFDDLISIRFYDGRPGQQADMKLVADTAELGRTWKETSTCTGQAVVVVEREWSADKFDKGRPNFEWVLRGLRLYDPRKDSTVAGGAGAHRLDDPATWEFGPTGHNPALQRLNYQLGLRGRISQRTLIGEGKTLGQLDLSSYLAAMNVCDTPRAGKPTYMCSLVVKAEDDHTEILREFDDAMAGYGANRRGLSGVIPGAPQIPVATITPDDIPADRAQELRRRKNAFELYNHLSGQFISPENLWQPESLTPVYVNADVAADGRPRQTSNDFLQVTDADVAQRLLTIRYRQQRLGGRAAVPVSRRLGFRVMEGEWITFDGRTWLITGWRCDGQLRVTLTLAETSAAVYGEGGIAPGPIIIPSPPPANPGLLSTVQSFAVEVGEIEGGEGHEVPALRFTWAPPEDPTITAVRFEYFIGADPTGQTIYTDRAEDVEAGEYVTSNNVQPYVHYTARATITTVPDRFKTWTPWVTTASATGPIEIYPPGLIRDIQNFINDATEWIGPGTRQLINEARRLALSVVNQDFANYDNLQQLRTELTATAGDLTAKYTNAISVATGPGSALAQRIEALEVTFSDVASASALNALTVRVTQTEGGIEALSQALTLVEAEVAGKASASALLALTSVVTTQGNDISALSAALIDVQATIPNLATASSVLLLQSQVDSVEVTANGRNRVFRGPSGTVPSATAVGDLWIQTNQNNRIMQATAVGAGNWTLSEDQRIPALQTIVTAISNAVIALESGYGDATANANFRMTTTAGPAGYSARIGMEARTGGAGAYRAASFFIDVPAATGDPTRIVMMADQVVITNGSVVRAPFIFMGGGLWLNEVNVGWARISTAVIGNLIVQDAMIPANLITASNSYNSSRGNISISTGSHTTDLVTGTAVINSFTGKPILFGASINASYSVTAGASNAGLFGLYAIMQVLSGSTVIQEYEFARHEANMPASGTAVRSILNTGLIQVGVPSAGNYTFRTVLRVNINATVPQTLTGSTSGGGNASCPRH